VGANCLAHVYGNVADHPDRVRRYSSDMTDAEWVAIRPLLPVPAWFQGGAGSRKATATARCWTRSGI
jgi:hypothetical protein